MQDDAFVVVFPSEFAKSRISRLISNIKKILKIRGQGFEFVRRDSNVILVRANDPVLASSTINQLFGIEKIAIARKAGPDLKSVVSEVTRLGGNLLLRGERFLVRVEGDARGFVPKDAEIAITSSIIEKRADQGAVPGSESKYDKLLYTYVTKNSAYVCIFLDYGHGGIPNSSQERRTLCPVYDEISAISCIESIKQGYAAKIIVPYRRRSELNKIAKLLSRVIRFIPSSKTELEFYNFDSKQKISSRFDFQNSVVQLCRLVVGDGNISKISVPVTNQMFPIEFVDSISRFLSRLGAVPHFPLEGKEDSIRDMAREYVLDKFVSKIKIEKNSKFSDISEARFKDNAANALKTKRAIAVEFGPNNVHDILDALE